MVYLTPFSQSNVPQIYHSRIIASKVYHPFNAKLKKAGDHSAHITWKDIIDLYDLIKENELIAQHLRYIEKSMLNPLYYEKNTNRFLDDFLGREYVDDFYKALDAAQLSNKSKIILIPNDKDEWRKILDAFDILLQSDEINKKIFPKDEFPKEKKK